MEWIVEKGLIGKMRIYEQEIKTADYETDHRLEMTPYALLSHCQEVAMEDLLALGCGHRDLFEHHSVFLLSRLALRIHRLPQSGEKAVFSTWVTGTKGALFLRLSEVRGGDGELLAEGEAHWILVNPETRKILRPRSFFLEFPVVPKQVGIQVEKFAFPEGMEACGEHRVRYSDLDCNGHVNNAGYVKMLYDFGLEDPFSARIGEMQLYFAHEALLGEELQFCRHREGDTLYFQVKSGERMCFGAQCREK